MLRDGGAFGFIIAGCGMGYRCLELSEFDEDSCDMLWVLSVAASRSAFLSVVYLSTVSDLSAKLWPVMFQ